MAFGYNTPYGQPYYQPPMMDNLAQMRAQQQPVQPGMIWVQGEAAGKSYLVAAGNTVPLWDSERQTIYLKSVDASGVPTMRILDYTERTQAAAPGVEYVTRAEYDTLVKQVAELKEAGNG